MSEGRCNTDLQCIYPSHSHSLQLLFTFSFIKNTRGLAKMSENQPCSEIIDDIEDLISSQDIQPKQRYANKKTVSIRARKTNGISERPEKQIFESFVPGQSSVYMKTWGCAHNNSDAEYMGGLLHTHGYTLTSDKDTADLWLLNR